MKTTIIARPNGRYIHLRGHWSRFSVARYCTRLGILSYRAAVCATVFKVWDEGGIDTTVDITALDEVGGVLP